MNTMDTPHIFSTTEIVSKTNFAVESKLEPYYTGGKIKLTNDGKTLFCTCGIDIKVIQVSTGKAIKTFKGEDDAILNFALSSDDRVLVTSHKSGLMKQWDWEEDKVVKTWLGTHKGPISCMTFDSTTTLLATGGTDSTVKVWDIVHQYITHNLKGCQGVLSVVEYHPDAERLIVFGAANDYKIRAWDLATSKCIAVLEGHLSTVTCLSFTDNKSCMLSGGRDQVVNLWDISDEIKILRTIPVFEAVEGVVPILMNEVLPDIGVEDINSVCFVTVGNKGVLRAWSERGKLLRTQKQAVVTLSKEHDAAGGLVLVHAFYNEALDSIVVVTFEHNILFYKLHNFELDKQLVGFNDEVLDVTYFGHSDSHFAVATNSSNIKVFNVESLDCKLLKGHTETVLTLTTFPSDPLMMASGSKDNSIRIWLMDITVKDIFCIAVGHGHTHDVTSVACSRLKSIFLVSGSNDTCIKLWKISKEVRNKTITSQSSSSIDVTWTQIAHEKEVNSICVSPNDKLLASCSQDKLAKVWNLANGTLLATLRGHRRGLFSVQFSPVDQVVATSSGDGLIKIWSLTDFSCIKTFEGHECSVLKVLFLSRGMQLLSSSSDGLIKLWTIKLNECVKTLDGHNGKVWALQVNQSESAFISGGSDSNIVIWKDVTEIEKIEENEKKEQLIEQEQELQNLLQQKKYSKALKYCLRLEQPFRALTVVRELLMLPDGREQLETTMSDLRDDQIDVLIRFAATWNTNSKNCYEAQHILNILLKKFTSEELLKLPNIQSIVQGFLPYTERHYQRCNKLLQQAMFVDYTWQRMKMSEQVQSDN